MKLSKIERLKLQLTPQEYYKRIESLDPIKITDADRFYLKNFGIYNTKLRPEEFMLRIRIPAGRIQKEQLRFIVALAKSHGASILITARAQMELHRLKFSEAVAIHKKLLEHDIATFATLTDNIRNIVTDVADGLEGMEVYHIIDEMDRFATDCKLLGMIPRKFNTAIVGVTRSVESFFTNDAFFALARKDGVEGFNLYLGGKNSHFAQDADIFVLPAQVPKMFEAIIKTYQKYGLRQNRTRSRLFHLLEEIGLEEFKNRLKEYYSDWESAGEYLLQKERPWSMKRYEKGVLHRYETRFGEIEVGELERLLDFEAEIRFGIDQNIYLLAQKELGIGKKPREILVCAGEKYCIYSLFDTKQEAWRLPLQRIENLSVRVGYSGCLKGCGRHIAADIGLVGIRTNLFGEVERGVRFYLGGLYSTGELPARLIFWAVPLRCLRKVIEIVLDEYERSEAEDFESFSKTLLPLTPKQLAYHILRRFVGEESELSSLPGEIEDEELKELERRAFS